MCAKGAPCCHVLLLSPKDSSDADRLWRRFRDAGTEPGHVDLSKRAPVAEHAVKVEAEPLALVRCGDCRADVPVFAYIATLIQAHRIGLNCHACQEAA
jgi:hypothetical protein